MVVIGCMDRPADFQRVLAAPQRSRSPHFAIHYVAGGPSRARPLARAAAPAVANAGATALVELPLTEGLTEGGAGLCAPAFPGLSPELSTGPLQTAEAHVDESGAKGHWLGLVVPKRHAKRAVTRNLIKRQLRAAMLHHAPSLPEGLWVVRLRAPFDRQQFTSPASEVLRLAAHDEIGALFARAAHNPLPPMAAKPRGRR